MVFALKVIFRMNQGHLSPVMFLVYGGGVINQSLPDPMTKMYLFAGSKDKGFASRVILVVMLPVLVSA
jgi:hypothetical protein